MGMLYTIGNILNSTLQWGGRLKGMQMCRCIFAPGVPDKLDSLKNYLADRNFRTQKWTTPLLVMLYVLISW